MTKAVFLLLCVSVLFLHLDASVGNKIKQQANYLKSKGRMEKRITRKLNDLANEILGQIKNLNRLKQQIDNLNKNIKSNEVDIERKYKILDKLLSSNKELSSQKKDLEKKIIKIIAKDFSYYLINNKNFIETKDSIVAGEVVEKMDTILRREFRKLSISYENINGKISTRKKEIKSIKIYIDNSKKQKERLLRLKKRRVSAIKKLNNEKSNYKNRLYRIKKEKLSIRETLEKLKILKKAQNLKAQRKKELRRRVKRQGNSKLSVRQIGSSYQVSKVKRYRGAKTIAPLTSFVVKRKFGNYIDPIYNIKIFNESVTLASKIKNAKVKNILNGKVVFAKDTAVLDKVIIIENYNGIHTIYAHLSKIAPTIKVGKKIKKGYIIGRVDRDLTFEVTQKNYHINPLQLIKLN
ncbi:MAG: peptidoglycan DD-metalloendopeptidase family protein [Sulfurospirillum sp.]